MKKLLFTILSSFVIASSSYADQNFKIEQFKLVEASLFDGRKINFKKHVKEVLFLESEIDYLELNSGEVVDHTDISAFTFFHADNLMMARVGVDGGG
mgnify:CR=1 FL=1|jgi:hypothetical protein